MPEIMIPIKRVQWIKSILNSQECSKCGCRLVALTDEGPQCARCNRPIDIDAEER